MNQAVNTTEINEESVIRNIFNNAFQDDPLRNNPEGFLF